MVAGFRGDLRQEETVSERRAEWDHARRSLLPGRERLHPDLRPHAQRQSRAWFDLPSRRLFRLFDRRRHGFVAPEFRRRLHRCGPPWRHSSGCRVPSDGGAGSSPDAGHDRDFDRARRPYVVGFRRKFVADPDADMASRTSRSSPRHRGQIIGRGGLSLLSDRSPRHLPGLGRDWRCDVAGFEPHSDRHDRARGRRRPRHALGDGGANSARVRHRLCLRRRTRRNGRRCRRDVSVAVAGRRHALSPRLAHRGHRRRRRGRFQARRLARSSLDSPSKSDWPISRPMRSSSPF